MARRRTCLAAIACAVTVAGCTPADPAAADADPVLIVAGTGAPSALYEPLATRLRLGGYAVSIHEIAAPLSPFEESAVGVADRIAELVEQTDSDRVDVIGHSQGVVLTRYAAKFLGSAEAIDVMVSLGGGIHGSELATQVLEAFDCFGIELCRQAATGSPFQVRLNSPSDTLPGIRHVNFASVHDTVSTPVENGLMTGPGDVTNVVVQEQCPGNLVDHLGLAFDGPVATGIDDALAGRPVTLDCAAR